MDYVEYFKNKEGFSRFILGLRDKYESLGKFSGSIKIRNISEEEKRDFEKFFGENFEVGSDVAIPLRKFEKIISRSKFTDFDYYRLISAYFDDDAIETKKEKRDKKQRLFLECMDEVIGEVESLEFSSLLEDSKESSNALNRVIKKRYYRSKKNLHQELLKIDILLSNKPKIPMSMPIYASLTGNPHFLDYNTPTSNLFFHVLCLLLKEKFPMTTQEKHNMLESINVYSDTLSNFVITNNLMGDSVLEDFQKYGPLNLNIDNVEHIKSICGFNDKIFVFENPSILNHFKDYPLSIIITSGIPNLAFYKLLEKVDSETEVFYNGDFDPEGLLIAEKIKNFFPRLKLICYSVSDYLHTERHEKISASRLKKLDGVSSRELLQIKDMLLEEKLSGYQESNIPSIEKFINSVME